MWPSMRLRRGYAPASGSPCAFGGATPPQAAPRAAFGHGRGKPLPACAAPHPRPPAQAQGTLHPAGSSEQARQKSSGPLPRLWVLGALRLRLGGRHAYGRGCRPPRRGAPAMPFRQGLAPPRLCGCPPHAYGRGCRPPALAGAPRCTWRRTQTAAQASSVSASKGAEFVGPVALTKPSREGRN